MDNFYRYRELARIVVEAVTPLAVGSGEKSIMTNSLVAKDVNGLPYIPGTSLAGIFRHELSKEKSEPIFGKPGEESDHGYGSRIIFSDAIMIGKEGKVMDGLHDIDFNDEFYSKFETLPIRQHVRIGHRGTAEKGGKFDEQIVYKGCRFCFEVEILSTTESYVLKDIMGKEFHVGGGTRSGFGKLRVLSCRHTSMNLDDDFAKYLEKDSSMAEDEDWEGWSDDLALGETGEYTKYQLNLKPEDFMLFGSGLGDDDADMTPVREDIITWDTTTGKPSFKDNCILIPASSIKGALSHRTAFYFNKIKGITVENLVEKSPEDIEKNISAHVGKNNPAVKALFGSEGEMTDGSLKGQMRGRVMIDDIIETSGSNTMDKIINHVKIDRYTGGAMNGSLFSEKVIYVPPESEPFKVVIYVDNAAFSGEDGKSIKEAFIDALIDLASGNLPLGGGVNKGNGIFTGIIFENNKKIYPLVEQ